jgi:inosine/xanthosine triphosphatase
MKTIVVASTNPVKIQATRLGFEKMFPGQFFELHGLAVPSGVSDQPLSSPETLQGAYNRACAAAQTQPQADYWVGIEGGIEESGGEMVAFAWVVVYTPVLTGKGRTGTFFLPPAIARLIRQGLELGEADDLVFGQQNSKQANGAIGILTGNVIDRTRLYEHAVIMALAPFKNQALYSELSQD